MSSCDLPYIGDSTHPFLISSKAENKLRGIEQLSLMSGIFAGFSLEGLTQEAHEIYFANTFYTALMQNRAEGTPECAVGSEIAAAFADDSEDSDGSVVDCEDYSDSGEAFCDIPVKGQAGESMPCFRRPLDGGVRFE